MDCKTRKNEANKESKSYLKQLMNGEIHLINVKEFKKEFQLNPSMGDRLQYELHNYCKTNFDNFTNASIVAELALLCYSEVSVSKFSNLDRFLGCVYYITSYLLKSEKYSSALYVVNSLNLEKDKIIEAAKTKGELKNIFCSLHSSLISAAISLVAKVKSTKEKDYEISHELAMASLKVFLFSKTKIPGIEKKIIKTTKLYLCSLNHFKNEHISEFFDILQNIFSNIPHFSYLDYFIFHLLRLDQEIKNFEVQQMNFYLNKIIKIVSVALDFPSDITSSLIKFLNFFFNSHQNDSFLDEKAFKDLFVSSSKTNLYFIIIVTIFNYGIQFWWNKFENKSLENDSLTFICKLFKKLMEFHDSFEKHTALHYSLSDSSHEVCFSDVAVGVLHKIQYTIRLLLKSTFLPEKCSLISLAREVFKVAIKCIRIMEEKGCSHKQRSGVWKPIIIHHTNLIEDILKYSSSENLWLELRDCSHEVLEEIFNTEIEVPFDSRRISILFKRWHFANLKLEAFSDCFYVCMAYFIAFPEKESDVIFLWIQTKAESRNDIIQEVTVAESFKNWNHLLKRFDKNLKSTNSTLKSLLLMELKAYTFCSWKAFQDPKMGFKVTKKVWDHLRKFEPDLWERSFGLCSLIATNTFASNEEFPRNFEKECFEFIEYLISWKYNGKTQCRSLLLAANLKFFLFIYKLKGSEAKEDQINSNQMVLEYLKKVEEEKVKFGENADSNLNCDVISSSAYLNVELEAKYLEALNEVVELWEKALGAGSDVMPNQVEIDMWLQTMKHAAHFFFLIGEYQRSLFVWLLYYRLGKLRKDPAVILLGLSYLINNISNVHNSLLFKEAMEISNNLQVEGKEKNVVVELWLALASNCLKNQNENDCFEYLMKAKEIVESLGLTVSSSALVARFWCLVSKFLCLYPEREEAFGYPSGTDLRLTVFRAFSCANAGGRSNLIQSVAQVECLELIISMLQVNLWAFHFYEIYRKTDYMRLFLDDLYQIVHKLNLPTRTAELLLRLAEVDMIREKITECRAKVIKVKSILTTLSSKCGDFEKKRVDSPPLFDLSENEIETSDLRPISPPRFLQPNAASDCDISPVNFHLTDVYPSKSSYHLKSCNCYLCKNILIRILTMNALTLEAQIHEAEKNQKEAAVSFEQALEALNNLTQLSVMQTEAVARNLEKVFGQSFINLDFVHKSVDFFSARFLIKYGFFEIGCEKKLSKTLLKIIEKISQVMKKIGYKEKLLIWTFTELKVICYFLHENLNEKLSKKESPVVYKTVGNYVTPLPVRLKKKPMTKAPVEEKPKRIFCSNSNEDIFNGKDVSQPLIEENEIITVKNLRIRPSKLSFDSDETSTISKTVIKVPTKKISVIKPKKLDFDKTEASEEKEKNSSSLRKTRSRVVISNTGRRKCESLNEVKKNKNSSIVKKERGENMKLRTTDRNKTK